MYFNQALFILPIDFQFELELYCNVWNFTVKVSESHFQLVDIDSSLLYNTFLGAIINLEEDHYFLVNSDCRSCFSLIYYDWWSYFLGGYSPLHQFIKTDDYITFTWCINQLPLLNTFSFHFPQAFLLINFIITQLQPHKHQHYSTTPP